MNIESISSCTLCLCIKYDGVYNGHASKLLQELFPELPTPPNIILCKDCSSMLDMFHNTKLWLIENERSFKQKEFYELNIANFIMWSNGEMNDMNDDRKCQICSKAVSCEKIKNVCDELIQIFPFLDSRFCSNLELCKKCKNNMKDLQSFKVKYSKAALEIPYIKTEPLKDFEYRGQNLSPNGSSYKSDDADSAFTDVSKYSFEEQCYKKTVTYRVFIMERIKREIKPIKRNGVYLFNCPSCENIVMDLKKHFEEHKGHSSKILYSCDMCNFQSESLEGLQAHFCEGDTSANICFERHKCHICPFTTKQKGNLKTHLLIHKSAEEIQMYKCDQCKFQSRQKGNLKTHQLVHKPKDEIKMFKCKYCRFEARQKGNLQTHVLKKHKNINEVALDEVLCMKCKVCTFRTKQRSVFRRHMNSHKKLY